MEKKTSVKTVKKSEKEVEYGCGAGCGCSSEEETKAKTQDSKRETSHHCAFC